MRDSDALPPDPADLRLLLQALVDGELDAAASLALERRIAEDAALAADYARLAALQTAVRRLPRPPVSAAFQARIAGLAATSEAPARPPRRAPRVFDWRAIAASVVLTAAVASGATYWAAAPGASDRIADAVAASHRRSLLAASPIDVASSDRHVVKPWLDAKVGVSPPTIDLAAQGFTLVGGRVDVIGQRVVPALVCRHNEHLITLVAAPREEGAASVAPAPFAAGGFSGLHWTDGAFSYWAISDVEHAVLDDFAARFRAAAAGG
jgi:anti-sigma factor RsiW